jgi:hypothetical protein
VFGACPGTVGHGAFRFAAEPIACASARSEVTDRHTALDYAQLLSVSDRYFRGASQIVLVQDNLSTHKPVSFPVGVPESGRTENHPSRPAWMPLVMSTSGGSTAACRGHLGAKRTFAIEQGAKAAE